MKQRTWPSIYIAALLLFCLLVSLSSYGVAELHQGHFWGIGSRYTGTAVILQFVLLTLLMFGIWYCLNQFFHKEYVQWVLLVGIVIRLLLIPVEPYTSNDVDRYLFDGRLLWEGYDPYTTNHEAEELIPLRALWQPPSEHAAYVTLYPPLSLSLFALAASAGHEWAQWVWKAMLAIAGIVSLLLMAKLLKYRQQERYLPLFALSPILLIEGGVGAHIDGFSTLAVVAALYMWFRARWWFCGMCIALGALTKFLPLVLLGPIFLVAPNLASKAKLVFGFLGTVFLAYSIFFMLGLRPVGSLAVFFEKWRFGSPVFSFLEQLFHPSSLVMVIPVLMVSIMAFLGFYIWMSPKTEKEERALLGCQWALAAPLLLSPVVFPWYLMTLVPFSSLVPTAPIVLWLFAIPFTYEVLGQFACCSDWSPAAWPIWLVAMSLLLGFVFNIIRKRTCLVC